MSMFWGLSMKPNRKYTQTIVKSFHISGVALDEGTSAKFYITADKNKFIVATLNKNLPQMTLDLNFCRGDKIMFQTTGDGTVSLIGYLHDAEDSDDEEFEDDEYAALAKSLGADGKLEEGSEEGSDDDEDEDDEDADDNKLAAEYSSFLEEEESGEEEEDDEEGESDDEEDDDDDDSDEEEVQPKAKKAKIAEQAKKPAKEQNGVAKNDQKQQQQQQKSKKDKKAAQEPKKEQPKAKEAKQQPQQQAGGGERTITGGVKVHDLNAGSGPEAKQGKRVSVYYIGRLKSNNKTFDSMQKGNGFKFALGAGEVIKGWDVGVVGMKVGGKRRITCPAHMAYGARGHPPTIPPNSTLVFDVELKGVH